MLYLRKILFYLFFLIYLICCPALILYSLGYFIEPGEKSPIVQSGLIYLSTVPADAKIFIDGRKWPHPTPTEIPNLREGSYEVRLELNDFEPWQGKLPVESGKATVMDKILLTPVELKDEKLFEGPIQNWIPVPEKRHLIVSAGNQVKDFFVYDWEARKARPLIASGRFIPLEAVVLQFNAVPESKDLLLKTRSHDQIQYHRVKLEGLGPEVRTLRHLNAIPGDQITWFPDSDRYLFSYQDQSLQRWDSDSSSPPVVLAKDLLGYGLFERKIYVLQKEKTFYQMNLNGDDKTVLLDDARLHRVLFGSEEACSVYVFLPDLIFFIGAHGSLIGNRLPYHFVDKGVRGIKFHKKTKKLLLWQDERIGILSFPRPGHKDGVFEKRPEVRWIYEGGYRIQDAFWVYEDAYVLFQDGNQVFLLEIEPYGESRTRKLAEIKDKSRIHYEEKSGELYYVHRDTRDLHAIKFFHRDDLLDNFLTEFDEISSKMEQAE